MMVRKLCLLGAAVGAFSAAGAFAQTAEVTLARLDCGSGFNDSRRFSDTFAYTDEKKPFTFSCYVIKHGDDYMVWDTGYTPGSVPNATNKPLGELLAQLKVKPEQVKYVGISHFHADHTGQLDTVPNATLLIGQKEWDAITAPKPMQGVNVAGFKHWISGGGKVEPQPADKDVFGDGSVMILRTPGHTPGHQSLLVRLKEKGPVILVGDAAHFHENYDSNGVPGFNYDRAETIASLERIKGIAKNLKATVIIQHDPRDIKKLPAFPAAAK
jgi:glyoxylase-like metal-dependent hydrolase (beta-lactamase superfamily II)